MSEIKSDKPKTITVEIELDDETLINLTLYAHKRNITLNDAVNEILKRQLKLFKEIGKL